MPYVSCPACERVTFAQPGRHAPELCARCGEPLPLRRSIVPLSRYRALDDERPRAPERIAA